MDLKEYISEYFFGTNTSKFYEEERSFYREFIINNYRKEEYLLSSSKIEKLEIIVGRIVPNIMSLIGIVASVKLENPAIFFFTTFPSEVLRNFIIYDRKMSIESRKMRMNDMKDKWANHVRTENMLENPLGYFSFDSSEEDDFD